MDKLLETLYLKIWDIQVLDWVLFVVFTLLAFVLKKYITIFFTTVLYRLVTRIFSEYSGQQFRQLLTKPVSGFVSTTFFFLGIVQLLPKLDTVTIVPSLKRVITDPSKVTQAFSLFDILQYGFYLAFIYYGFSLLIRIIEYILNLRYHKAFGENDKSVQQVVPLVKDILKVVIWSLAIVVTLGVVFNFNVTTLLAGVGVGGIALAFAAKESLENLIASFMVLVDKPFEIGDWIKVGSTEGVIEEIGFRSSKLRTFDKSIIIIPNRKLIDSEVENFSMRGIRRVTTVVGGIYGVSQENIKNAINEIKQGLEAINGVNPDSRMWFDGFADSQFDLRILYYVEVRDDVDFFDVKHQANLVIYEAMYKYCQGFAFPTQTIIPSNGLKDVTFTPGSEK